MNVDLEVDVRRGRINFDGGRVTEAIRILLTRRGLCASANFGV